LALQFPVNWIDVKEPEKGALGRPDHNTARRIENLVRQSRCKQPFSVALGELHEVDLIAFRDYVQGFSPSTFFKIALAGCSDQAVSTKDNWRDRLNQLAENLASRTLLIPVFYADCDASRCPEWSDILDYCLAFGSRRILIDTWKKGTMSLVDLIPFASLRRMIDDANNKGIAVAIAGSIQRDQIPYLLQTGADVIGVRGAACKNQNRTSVMSEEALSSLCEVFSSRSQTLQGLADQNGT
jgi:hypothetical protein